MNTTHDNSSIEPTHLQERGVWGRAAEGGSVSPPFFHENNTTMNGTYETPLATAGPESAEENTIVHVLQTSLYHAARMKEYYEECACGYRCIATYGSILCRAILKNTEREYEKFVKSKEIIMQQIRPIALLREGGVGLRSVRSAPTQWRWENRTEVPVEERGACLLYRPVTYIQAFDMYSFPPTTMNQHTFLQHTFDHYTFDRHAFDQHVIDHHMSRQIPVCLLRENDVVDNGTVMCLQARGNECFYGNETIKAIMEFERPYHQEFKFPEFPEIGPTTWIVLFVLFFFCVGTLQKSRGGGA